MVMVIPYGNFSAHAGDRFMEASTAGAPVPSVCVVQQPQPPAPSQSALDQLTASVAALTAAVGEMRTDMETMRDNQQQHRHRGRSNSRYMARSQSQQISRPHSQLCYYHQRFGAAARKCAEPCTWPTAQQGNGQA